MANRFNVSNEKCCDSNEYQDTQFVIAHYIWRACKNVCNTRWLCAKAISFEKKKFKIVKKDVAAARNSLHIDICRVIFEWRLWKLGPNMHAPIWLFGIQAILLARITFDSSSSNASNRSKRKILQIGVPHLLGISLFILCKSTELHYSHLNDNTKELNR